MKKHAKIDYNGMRIQQSDANYGDVKLVVTIAENLMTGDDLIVWCADNQSKADSDWSDALAMFGPKTE